MKDAAFRTLIKGERQRLIRYVRSLFKETAEMDAEDILHDVLLKLLERSGASEPLQDATGYVYRAVKNRVIDFARTKKPMLSLDNESGREETSLMALLQDMSPGVLENLQSEEGERLLFEGLHRLSDIERQVVIAHEFEGVSFREMSIAMGVPQNTLLSHKSRGLKKLKEYFANFV